MRTTYVFRDGKVIPKHTAPPKSGVSVISDISPFVSPIDSTEITSRSALREHERKHQVRQIGNDYAGSEKPTWWDGRHDEA